MTKRTLWVVIGLISLIIFTILSWLLMIQDNMKINNNPSDYEIIEADIIDIKTIKHSDIRATISYEYNGMPCYGEVRYYNKDDSGKSTIQIAVKKKTGEVYRPGMHWSYEYISRIVVAFCFILLIFAKVHEDKKNA